MARPALFRHPPCFFSQSKFSISLAFSRSSFSVNPSLLTSSILPSSSSSSLSLSPLFSSKSQVSTVPVEFSPAQEYDDFEIEISRLEVLIMGLSNCRTLEEKHRVLDGDNRVKNFFFKKKNGLSRAFSSFNLESSELFLLKCLVASGQEHVLDSEADLNNDELQSERSYLKSAFYVLIGMIEQWDSNGIGGANTLEENENEGTFASLKDLLKMLGEVEKFYDSIGGIIGYQVTVLKFLLSSSSQRYHMENSAHLADLSKSQFIELHVPKGLDLSTNREYASQAAFWGIEGLPKLAEIYPLGGAGDRLDLVDQDTGECLPAAMLPFCGRTLLEGLIRDLQAREFLYYQIYKEQCVTPVAIMTSAAKNNHKRITALCETLSWFGRGQSNFRFFEQPLVPVVGSEDGKWLVKNTLNPICKPGGHGAIWKLAHEKGIFKWLYGRGRKGATIRQVSNVAAATDLTLLALAGLGLQKQKKLGFASCRRKPGVTQGVNVLVEKRTDDGLWAYGLTCIEYTEFGKFNITESPNSLQENFPANTNILYIDLASIEKATSDRNGSCLPGMVLNLKKPVKFMDHLGIHHSVPGGRLECTLQNIADYFSNIYSSRLYKSVEEELDTYIVYDERKKVTSSAKRRRRHEDRSLHQTPDGALLDIIRNASDLLSPCNIIIPEIEDNSKYLDSGPPFLILLHPALGPLWEVTRQKFCGGSIAKGSELILEVAEFSWKNVQLDGSMIIEAKNIVGSTRVQENGEPIIEYGYRCGRCRLTNVKVVNKGIDWSYPKNTYWKHEVQRHEYLKIILHGNSEFEAIDVILKGNHIFEVPDGYKLQVTTKGLGLTVKLDPIKEEMMDTGTWYWEYVVKDSHHIHLEMKEAKRNKPPL